MNPWGGHIQGPPGPGREQQAQWPRYVQRNFLRVPLSASKEEVRSAIVQVPEEDALAWLVTLGPFVPLDISLPGTAADGRAWPQWGNEGPWAKVTWGAGQAKFVAAVDWNLGSTFVVYGHTVTVDLVNVPDVVCSTGGAPATVPLPRDFLFAACTVTPWAGGRKDHRAPTKSLTVDVGVGNTGTFRLFPWSRRMRYWTRNTPAAASVAQIRFVDDPVPVSARYSPTATNWNHDLFQPIAGSRNFPGADGIEIPAQANWMQITNTGPGVLQWQLEFELDIG